MCTVLTILAAIVVAVRFLLSVALQKNNGIADVGYGSAHVIQTILERVSCGGD